MTVQGIIEEVVFKQELPEVKFCAMHFISAKSPLIIKFLAGNVAVGVAVGEDEIGDSV